MNQKVVLIARVSDVEQRQALPAQRLRLENYARKFDLASIRYCEFDESAYKGGRQKFVELIREIKAESAHQIVVFDKIDRFTRDASQKEVGTVSNLVQGGHIELHFPSDNLTITKSSPATDLSRLGIGMLLAKYYSDTSRDNVKRRFEQMRREGLYPHKAPVGYKNTQHRVGLSTKSVKSIVIDTRLAPFVLEMFELRARSLSYQAIASRLGTKGFVSPKTNRPYKDSVVSKMLANKFYIGIMTAGGKEYPHRYPQIVPKELFNYCQLVRQARQRPFHGRHGRRLFAFKSLVACGFCGRAVSSYVTKNNTYLKCANNTCKNPNTAEKLALADIQRGLERLVMPSVAAKELRDRLERKQAQQDTAVRRAGHKLAEINAKTDILYADRLAGRITAENHDRLAIELEKERQELKRRKNFLTSAPKELEKTISQMIYICQNARKLFERTETATKNLMLEILVSNLKLKDKSSRFR